MLFDKRAFTSIVNNHQNFTDIAAAILAHAHVTAISIKGNIPSHGPVLLISNHNGVFDTLLLASRMPRVDFHFLALSTYKIFGKSTTRHLLPIYRKRQLNHRLWEYPLSLQLTGHLPVSLTTQQIRTKNRDTITQAAQRINQGKLVWIFPGGSAGKRMHESSWKAGVGYLIKQITHPDTQVIFAHITGTKQSDITAYLHQTLRKMFFKPRPITIKFSKPRTLKKLVNRNLEPKHIAKAVEHQYYQNFSNLAQLCPNKLSLALPIV